MIIERSLNEQYLSNTWLVGDRPGGSAVVIDTGGRAEPILEAIEDHRLTLRHILCTHHHVDHILNNRLFVERFGCPIVASADEAEFFADAPDRTIGDGDEIVSGDLVLRAIATPGHTRGMLAFLVDGHVFTGDTLFRRTVGGTLAPGHTTIDDLKTSILERLLTLPPETVVHPGHTDTTTIGEELEHNPFVRAWRGVDPIEERPCTVFGRDATLLLRASDYDGGTKCWVRLPDGTEAIAPGSRVIDG